MTQKQEPLGAGLSHALLVYSIMSRWATATCQLRNYYHLHHHSTVWSRSSL